MTDLLTLLGALAVAQALLLAVAVLRRPGDSHPAVPAMSALLVAAGMALGAILLSHRWDDVAVLWLVEVAGTLAAGPLFYGWVARVLEEERRGRLRRHLVLPALVTAYVATTVLLLHTSGRQLPQPPIGALLLVQVGYTVTAAALVARRWRQPEASGRRRLIALLVALLGVVHLASFARWLRPDIDVLMDVVPATAVLLIYTLGFAALRQPRLLCLVAREESDPAAASARGRAAAGDTAAEPDRFPATVPVETFTETATTEPERRRYESSSLSAEQVEQLRTRLVRHMATAQPHLRDDLTLPDLARELDTLPTHLSRAVNETGESFPDLLARYRVDEAKRLLRDHRLSHLTVDALGGRAGFRSRSAFYDAFRRRVGVTPAAYRKGADGPDRPAT